MVEAGGIEPPKGSGRFLKYDIAFLLVFFEIVLYKILAHDVTYDVTQKVLFRSTELHHGLHQKD